MGWSGSCRRELTGSIVGCPKRLCFAYAYIKHVNYVARQNNRHSLIVLFQLVLTWAARNNGNAFRRHGLRFPTRETHYEQLARFLWHASPRSKMRRAGHDRLHAPNGEPVYICRLQLQLKFPIIYFFSILCTLSEIHSYHSAHLYRSLPIMVPASKDSSFSHFPSNIHCLVEDGQAC